MSALGSEPDMTQSNHDVRYSPENGHREALSECLLWARSRHQPNSVDYLIGGGEERRRDAKTQSLGGLQVDDELELDGETGREVRWASRPLKIRSTNAVARR